MTRGLNTSNPILQEINGPLPGPCAKQVIVAIVENHGRYWIGSNYCASPQKTCPRDAGEPGYDYCHGVCRQRYHAEARACVAAGAQAKGGTLYVLGVDAVCKDCRETAAMFGIHHIEIGTLPPGWDLSKVRLYAQ